MEFYKLKNIVVIFLSFTFISFSQQAYFGYIEEPTHPHSIALGSSGTAGSNGGFSFYNPANIGILESPFISFEYGMIWGDISRGLIESGWNFKEWFIGGSFQTQNNSFTVTDATGNYMEGAIGVEQASAISFIGGIKKGKFSAGLGINGFHHKIFDNSSTAISLSVGATYSVLPGKLNAGVSAIHLGSYFKGFYSNNYEVQKDLMPTTGRIGILWKDTLRNKFPINLSVDVVYSKNFDIITVPVGLEILPIPYLALRIGKRFLLQTEIFTSGIGIKWDNLSFDASFVPYSIENQNLIKWAVALRYELKRKDEKKLTGSTSQIRVKKETIVTPLEDKKDTLTSSQRVDTSNSNIDSIKIDTIYKPTVNVDTKDTVSDIQNLEKFGTKDTSFTEGTSKNRLEEILEQKVPENINTTVPKDTIGIPVKDENFSPLDSTKKENKEATE